MTNNFKKNLQSITVQKSPLGGFRGLFLALFFSSPIFAQTYHIKSPDGKIDMQFNVGKTTTWQVTHEADEIITTSPISVTLTNGNVLGNNVQIINAITKNTNTTFTNSIYKKKIITDHYNQLTINCKGNYGIIARAYNDGVAYRFFTTKKDSITIVNEEANFNFTNDFATLIPYVRDLRGTEQFIQSFEALYTKQTISTAYPDTLGFLPCLINEGNKKVVLLEADVENYPGMFITPNGSKGFKATFAGYPLTVYQGGFNKLNTMVSKRADYMARVSGTKKFPWRVAVISDNDAALANNDMVQKLAAPSRIADESWIKPGKVAWDWWNDWNISHVDFRAGINTETYKYYIDFAAENKLEYIILDEGWSDDFDILKINEKLNLKDLLAYAKQKNVGIILWASYVSINTNMVEAFKTYAAMGVKGFKIDFMDRDDQPMVASLYSIAKTAADYKLLIDYHGMYKPTGLQRTYPNVLNFEGVKGLENNKWTPNDDVPEYDVTIPFIRMMAGPMDYTPGAMRNATKPYFRPIHAAPMSQGTRCHQIAMYTVFEAPLQMLADNPTAYKKEQECTNFIAKIPTVFDETIALNGKVGEYIAIARKKENTWYVGAMTNWTAREMPINFSFLGEGDFVAEIFKDGINADRDATDYKKEIINITAKSTINFYLQNGGGLAMIITKK